MCIINSTSSPPPNEQPGPARTPQQHTGRRCSSTVANTVPQRVKKKHTHTNYIYIYIQAYNTTALVNTPNSDRGPRRSLRNVHVDIERINFINVEMTAYSCRSIGSRFVIMGERRPRGTTRAENFRIIRIRKL